MNTMVFISQPMRGLDPEDIKSVQDHIFKEYKEKYPDRDFQLINPYYPEPSQMEISHLMGNHAVKMLGESISNLSYADVVLFAKGWENFPGCRIEHRVCTYYNIPIEYA